MASAAPERSSSWIPWTFVGFFAVVLIANGIMLFFALQSWTGIETEDAYEKGLAFNEQIADAETQARLGWRAELAVEPAGPRRAKVTLHLLDAAGAPLDRAVVTAQFLRPTQEGHDLSLALPWQGEGRYGAETALPLAGLWDLEVEVRHRRGSLRLEDRIHAP